jgi:hypothetical protein
LALVIPAVVAVTSTAPTACGGEVALQRVDEVQLTELAFADPNRKVVALAPAVKPLPVTVTVVPPAAGPELGLRLVIAGTYL